MYYVSAVVAGAYILLYVLSRRQKKPFFRKGIMGIFDRISSELIVIKNKIVNKGRGSPLKNKSGKNGITGYLEQLNPGDDIPALYDEYVVKKLSLTLMVVILGTAAAAGMKYNSDRQA